MTSFEDEPHESPTRGPFDDDMSDEFQQHYDYNAQHPQLVVDPINNNYTDNPHSPPVYGFGISTFASDGPILPDPSQMQEEGHTRREWRRKKVTHLEEKEKMEKEIRNQIIKEAEEYKGSFYEKRKLNCETNKKNNREREKVYLANQDKFHKEACKHYWKAIAQIIPREVPNIERRRGKKEVENKPSVHVIQGPKPGKPTDLARMRQMISKLKQNPPSHMMPPPPKEEKDAKEGSDDKGGKSSTQVAVVVDTRDKLASPTKDATSNGEPQDPIIVEGDHQLLNDE